MSDFRITDLDGGEARAFYRGALVGELLPDFDRGRYSWKVFDLSGKPVRQGSVRFPHELTSTPEEQEADTRAVIQAFTNMKRALMQVIPEVGCTPSTSR